MKIKNIIIQNFKGFEYKKFNFNQQFNVAIGNNAMGKSTLLHALQVALGAYLQCLDIPANPSYRRQFKKTGERFVKWDDQLLDYLPKDEETKIEICAQFLYNNQQVCWTRKLLKNETTTHSQSTVGNLIQLVNEIMEIRKSSNNILMPLIANFGTDRKATEFRKVNKVYNKRTRLEKGYLTSLKEDTNFNGALEWIHNYEYNVKNKIEFEGTKDAFYNALNIALPYLKNICYNSQFNQFEAEILFDNLKLGKTIHSNMSDGLKSMLYLVAELAFRCVILNGFKGINAVVETEGVVLIDEVDMHLHPTWQRHIVHDLKKAFPNLQFIVTTHSPYIVQSVRVEELINLDIQTSINPADYSIEVISEEIMNVSNAFSTDKEAEEEQSIEYFQLLNEAVKSNNKELYKIKLELLENAINDSGLRAFLKTNRIAKNII
ncbi:MAG: AAA family ATPase, partial [Sediminibacterium sp.]|nr:AAA family ATPase [Sediminibacterium sp.]